MNAKKPKRNRGRRWTSLSLSVRARNPICERCKEQYSEEVHHSVPLHLGGAMYDPRNLVALCRGCHKAVTTASISQIKKVVYSGKNDALTPETPFIIGHLAVGEHGIRPKAEYSRIKRERLGVKLKWRPEKIK